MEIILAFNAMSVMSVFTNHYFEQLDRKSARVTACIFSDQFVANFIDTWASVTPLAGRSSNETGSMQAHLHEPNEMSLRLLTNDVTADE